jgi:hypothetical protein
LRRRTPLRRQRAALWAHGHKTTSPDNLPELGQNIADNASRAGGAERFQEAAGPNTIAVDRALLTSDDARRKALARDRVNTAQPHEVHPLSLLQPIPGMGKILSRVWRYDRHPIDRCPRGQAVASDGRLVKCRQDSGGKRVGTAGKKSAMRPSRGPFLPRPRASCVTTPRARSC